MWVLFLIEKDPDRQALNADLDLDPAKWCRFDRIRIHSTANRTEYIYSNKHACNIKTEQMAYFFRFCVVIRVWRSLLTTILEEWLVLGSG